MFAKTLTAMLLSAAFAAHVQAAPAPLPFKTITLEAKTCADRNCHESTVAYPVTGDRHLDNWVRKQFRGTHHASPLRLFLATWQRSLYDTVRSHRLVLED